MYNKYVNGLKHFIFQQLSKLKLVNWISFGLVKKKLVQICRFLIEKNC